MPIKTVYTCDKTGSPCNDTDIVADTTGATQRVVLDATIYYPVSTTDPTTNATTVTVGALNMGQHVFASLSDALAWAKTIKLP
jgi:alcohol dehydrogenase YqhD (iron-dependent ADH family)